jgi:DNA repair ATPase RecN
MKWMAAIGISLAVAMTAACGGDDEGDATPTPSVCDQADNVQQSVEDLANLDVIASGTDGLTAAVDEVRTEVEALRQTLSDDVRPEAEALETAVTDARETLSSIDSDARLSERIAAVEEAIGGIATAAANLRTALDQEC